MSLGWKKSNIELINQQNTHKVDLLVTDLVILRELKNLAIRVITESEVPIYFDLQLRELRIFTYFYTKEVSIGNHKSIYWTIEDLVQMLGKKLKVNFMPCANPDGYFTFVGNVGILI